MSFDWEVEEGAAVKNNTENDSNGHLLRLLRKPCLIGSKLHVIATKKEEMIAKTVSLKGIVDLVLRT